MHLLALDTSTQRAAVAVARADGAVIAAALESSRRHGRDLVPALRDALRGAGVAPRELGGVAVGLGPGSYTGLRIGLTAAKLLAYAAGAGLVGLDSLELLARNADDDATAVAVVVDAQRGDVYAADFARDAPGGPLRRLGPTRVEPADAWAARLAPGTVVLGPALERPAAPLPDHVRVAGPEAWHPDPGRLAAMARIAWDEGRRDDPWFLEPVYLRRSAAEDQWDALGRP